MDKKTFYITTPIYYPSDNAHIGHSYSTVAADTVARYKRLRGYDVMFLTGTDEHGMKIEQKAKQNGTTPKAYVDKIVANFKGLWNLLNISNDRFIRTTDDYHIKAVQKIFEELYKKGEIYKGKYEGWYCTPCEAFWTKTQITDGKCPDCGREVKWTQEEAYFFKISKYADKLLKLYEDNPEFIQPESRKNEMISFIKSGLDDLCVSRTSFSWGIPVTFDEKHVVYVWLDALTNYITAMGYGSEDESDYKKYWPADVHFIGKEIVRFHAIIWPAVLMALNLPLPKQIYGHGWLLFGDSGKMSKSKGNVVDPRILCERYGVDAIRYFLLREIPFGSDGWFTNEALISRINYDLANDFGNLLSRTCAMIEKYFAGTLPQEKEFADIDDELSKIALDVVSRYEKLMDKFQFSSAISEVWKLISRTNKYIDETMPWVLGKDDSKKTRLGAVLYNLCEALRFTAVLIRPFMPQTSDETANRIGATEEMLTWESLSKWGIISQDTTVIKGKPIFPRIDADKEIEELNTMFAQSKKEIPGNICTREQIGIEDFAKIELKVGKIIACEPVKKAKKLLKLTINDGTSDRTVASGIAQFYKPEELVNRHIILVSNLKPAILCKVESNGMILAADTENGVKVIFVDDIPEGSIIR